MQLTEDEIIQKYAKRCGHCGRNMLFYTNMNGLAFHADIM